VVSARRWSPGVAGSGRLRGAGRDGGRCIWVKLPGDLARRLVIEAVVHPLPISHRVESLASEGDRPVVTRLCQRTHTIRGWIYTPNLDRGGFFVALVWCLSCYSMGMYGAATASQPLGCSAPGPNRAAGGWLQYLEGRQPS